MSFSMLNFSIACVAKSTASCCMSSDMSAFLITAFFSDMLASLTAHGGEEEEGKKFATLLQEAPPQVRLAPPQIDRSIVTETRYRLERQLYIYITESWLGIDVRIEIARYRIEADRYTLEIDRYRIETDSYRIEADRFRRESIDKLKDISVKPA